MTGVVELLATVADSAPLQRVRNYHLTDAEASPRPRDFTTAMKRTDGAVWVRLADAERDRFVRFADPDWELVERDAARGPTTVRTLDGERVRRRLEAARPELVARDEICGASDRERVDTSDRERTATSGYGRSDASEDERTATTGDERTVAVRQYADLYSDAALDRSDAEAVADALPAGDDELVFALPPALAEETVLESVAGSDRVFVAEAVPDRETDRALYLRQGRRGGLIPKAPMRTYELAVPHALDAKPTERPESA